GANRTSGGAARIKTGFLRLEETSLSWAKRGNANMKRTNNDTTPPGQWVQILQQTLVHLAHSNFTINVGNSHRQGDRLAITIDGIRRCIVCNDLALASAMDSDICQKCSAAI
ncbi:MAG: hypothetical protein WBF31_09815, partial [Anaerolineae bacterium]